MENSKHSDGYIVRDPGLQRNILAVLITGGIMASVDSTIVILAFPDMVKSLGSNFASMIWVILSYMLVVALLTTQLGRLGDIYGRGKMFNLGFLGFTIGSALCGAAPDVIFLIASRVVQGVGGALMQANTGAIIADTFPPEKRGRVYGLNGIGWSTGSVLGIILGGVITTFLGWRYIFYINLPIGAIALYLGYRYLKDETHARTSIDWRGMIALGAILLLFSYGAMDTVISGITSFNVGLMVLALLLIPVFILIEKRVKFPTIDIAEFRNRYLASSMFSNFFFSLGFLAVSFMVIMYLQGVRGLSPLNASLLLVPSYVILAISAPQMGKLGDRIGHSIVATAGLLVMVLGVAVYATIGAATPLYFIIIGSMITGVGASMYFPSNNTAIMNNVRQEFRGSASGLMRTIGNVGAMCSFVVALAIASNSIPREEAFQIFLGTSNLSGDISTVFVTGLHAALITSAVMLFIAAVLSHARGKERAL
ncbi:MAG: MFS transporter [Candidatus Micrarchaeota archaeon]|nr:MFS transporter [Candidatus Micrarchaeota archaeon]